MSEAAYDGPVIVLVLIALVAVIFYLDHIAGLMETRQERMQRISDKIVGKAMDGWRRNRR